jgi:hypothetical protein
MNDERKQDVEAHLGSGRFGPTEETADVEAHSVKAHAPADVEAHTLKSHAPADVEAHIGRWG